MKKFKGSLLLILAAAIWGTAFTAQTQAAQSIQPFTFNAVRSLIGCAVLAAFIGIRDGALKKNKIVPASKREFKKLLVGGIICGTVLFIATNFQQYGIYLYPSSVHNVSGRSGFITAMYVVLVPVCGLFFGKKVPFAVWSAVGLAIISLYLLCFTNGISGIYTGDMLMLLCALSFTAHIITIDRVIGESDGVKLSCIQFFVAGILSLICMFIFEKPSFKAILAAWLPIMYAGVLSSGVAYTLQIVGQRDTEPAVASILMSLECVFAGIGGWVILKERLSPREMFGCALMFAAVILAQSPAFIKRKNKKEEIENESCG